MKAPPQTKVDIRHPNQNDCAAFVSAVRRSRTLHGPWIEPKPVTPKEFAAYLERVSQECNRGFLVIDRKSRSLAGVININNIIRGCFQSASLGYYAFLPHAGQGLMIEGMLLVLKHAFETLRLHRIEANIQPANVASKALAAKAG